MEAGAAPPFIVSAADTVYTRGDVRRFVGAFAGSGAAGAVAVRLEPSPGPDRHAVSRRDDRVEQLRDDDPANPWSAAPLWGVGAPVVDRLCLDRPPHELENAFQATIDAGEAVLAVEIGKTRDLTYPLDLVRENFPYLRST